MKKIETRESKLYSESFTMAFGNYYYSNGRENERTNENNERKNVAQFYLHFHLILFLEWTLRKSTVHAVLSYYEWIELVCVCVEYRWHFAFPVFTARAVFILSGLQNKYWQFVYISFPRCCLFWTIGSVSHPFHFTCFVSNSACRSNENKTLLFYRMQCTQHCAMRLPASKSEKEKLESRKRGVAANFNVHIFMTTAETFRWQRTPSFSRSSVSIYQRCKWVDDSSNPPFRLYNLFSAFGFC